jgi:hypothetical protein
MATTKTATPHSIFVTILAEVLGISVMAIVADFNDTLGKIAVALMVGWLIIFLITNDQLLTAIEGKL